MACRTTSITLQVYINFCNMNQWSHVPCRIYNTSVKRYRWYGHIATYGDVWVYFRCRDRDSDNTHFVNPVFVVHWSQSIYSNKTSYCEKLNQNNVTSFLNSSIKVFLIIEKSHLFFSFTNMQEKLKYTSGTCLPFEIE